MIHPARGRAPLQPPSRMPEVPSLDVLARAAASTLQVSLPTIVQAAAGTLTTEVCNVRLDAWSRALVRQAGIEIVVKGREHVVPGEAYVVMSNHQSHYDIPVLFQALRIPLRMVAKKEIFRIPFMAGAMRAAGFVEIDRSNRSSAMTSLSSARESLHSEVSIWIAPEGTRSLTGKVASFKKGGFHLAVQSRLRILPVSIWGTRDTLPARGLRVTRGQRADVVVGAPIDPAAYGSDRLKELVAAVRASIIAGLPAAARD